MTVRAVVGTQWGDERKCKIVDGYSIGSSLPTNARQYVDKTEQVTQLPVKVVSLGPERNEILRRP